MKMHELLQFAVTCVSLEKAMLNGVTKNKQNEH